MIELEVITGHLESMGCNLTVIGEVREVDGFKSIHAIERSGVYYLKGGLIQNPPTIRESIIIVSDRSETLESSNTLVVVDRDPQILFYQLMTAMHQVDFAPGVHPTAIVDAEAVIADDAHVGAYAVIGKCRIGSRSRIESHVVIYDNTTIGSNVHVQSNTSVGASGMAWIWDENGNRVVQPQTGGTLVEDDCLIGTNVTIVRGSVNERTMIGKGTVMAHGTKIGHGARIGAENHFANNVSIAGNVVSQPRCFFGSASAVRPQVTLQPGTIVGAGAVVTRSNSNPNEVLVGVPAKVLKTNGGKGLSGVPDPHEFNPLSG